MRNPAFGGRKARALLQQMFLRSVLARAFNFQLGRARDMLQTGDCMTGLHLGDRDALHLKLYGFPVRKASAIFAKRLLQFAVESMRLFASARWINRFV